MKRHLLATGLLGLLFAGPSLAQECALEISGNDQIQYDKKELKVSSSCEQVTLTLKHIGQLAENVMGHNWVLTTTADFMPVAQAGQGAGPTSNFVPQGDKRVLAATEVIGGGEETSITFDMAGLEAGGDYTFFCSFPGHFVLMNGKFIVE